MRNKLGLAAISLAAFLSQPSIAATHLNQSKVLRHVTLVSMYAASNNCGNASFSSKDFYQVLPNGAVSDTPFVVPAHDNLVITDIDWSVYSNISLNSFVVDRSLNFGVILKSETSSHAVFFNRGTIITTSMVNAGRFGGNEHFTAGLVVGSGVEVCPYASEESSSWSGALSLDNVILHGYLTK